MPKNDLNWKGPWDCAEFISWLVFQEGGVLFGCTDDAANPAQADAYTGAWQRDVGTKGISVSVDQAAATPGGIVLRFPPGPGEMGHIALCDGNGGTIEAKGRRYGVVADTVHGRTWNAGVLIPGINYAAAPAAPPKVEPPDIVYELGAKNMQREIIFNIQQALVARGFDPGQISGDYDAATQNAVADFQRAMGLVVDGSVGPETAESLGISLVSAEAGPIQPGNVGEGLDVNRLLALLLSLFGSTAQSPGKGADKPEQMGDYLQTLLPQLLPLLLPLLLQATPAGAPLQVVELLLKLLAAKPVGAPTPSPAPTDVLTLLLQLLGGRRLG